MDSTAFIPHRGGFLARISENMSKPKNWKLGFAILGGKMIGLLLVIAAMMMIPFSLCSARLQVFLFFTSAVFSPRAAPWVLFSLYVMSFFLAFFTAWMMSFTAASILSYWPEAVS